MILNEETKAVNEEETVIQEYTLAEPQLVSTYWVQV